MKVQLIIPAIACIFILLSVYHLAAALRNTFQGDHQSRIVARVRKRIGIVFLLVGAGLLGYYWLVIFI